jgi:hypothetical protein
VKLNTPILEYIIQEELDKLTETTVKLSTHKDASFEPGRFVAILGKKGRVKLDKNSVHQLAKVIRTLGGKFGMGWSFTEAANRLNNITEGKSVRLSNGVNVNIEFNGLTLKSRQGQIVFLDRSEMAKFFQATSKYLR